MKNGFKPGVYEERGLYVGQWVDDAKQGEFATTSAFLSRLDGIANGRQNDVSISI